MQVSHGHIIAGTSQKINLSIEYNSGLTTVPTNIVVSSLVAGKTIDKEVTVSIGNIIVIAAVVALVGLLFYRFVIQKKDDGSKRATTPHGHPIRKPGAKPPTKH